MIRILFAAALLFAAFSTNSARAELLTFDITWSGETFGNSATATGSVTIDDTVLPNPGFSGPSSSFESVGIVSFTITVRGDDSGNGTFTEADYRTARWDSGNFGLATLDLTAELVGQPTNGRPWGTATTNLSDRAGGDFNIFSSSLAPTGVGPFQIATRGGSGSSLLLTSFKPAGITTVILGDTSGDGFVNFLDIAPFIAFFPIGGFSPEADINGDGMVDFLDIPPFLALMNAS